MTNRPINPELQEAILHLRIVCADATEAARYLSHAFTLAQSLDQGSTVHCVRTVMGLKALGMSHSDIIVIKSMAELDATLVLRVVGPRP